MDAGATLFATGTGLLATIALAVALLALAGVVWLLVRQQRIIRQYRHWMAGTSGGSLETMLTDHVSRVRETAGRTDALAQQAGRLEKEGRRCLQHAAIVRFNPYHDMGSDQSFSVALADAYGDGVVLSSLHARDATRVYGKPLVAWESTYTLTDEEKDAIARARSRNQER